MTNVIKIGVVPGRLSEVLIEAGMTVAQVAELADLSTSGFDIRIDGSPADNDTVISNSSKVIVLSKKIKGNVEGDDVDMMIKIGVVPGRLTEVLIESGMNVQQVAELASLSLSGYDIRIDGVPAGTDTVVSPSSKVIVLSKKIKGNADLVKVGVVPGRLAEVLLEEGTTVGEAIALADLSASGYDIRVDGVPTDVDTQVGSAKVIVLSKKIKGNDK